MAFRQLSAGRQLLNDDVGRASYRVADPDELDGAHLFGSLKVTANAPAASPAAAPVPPVSAARWCRLLRRSCVTHVEHVARTHVLARSACSR